MSSAPWKGPLPPNGRRRPPLTLRVRRPGTGPSLSSTCATTSTSRCSARRASRWTTTSVCGSVPAPHGGSRSGAGGGTSPLRRKAMQRQPPARRLATCRRHRRAPAGFARPRRHPRLTPGCRCPHARRLRGSRWRCHRIIARRRIDMEAHSVRARASRPSPGDGSSRSLPASHQVDPRRRGPSGHPAQLGREACCRSTSSPKSGRKHAVYRPCRSFVIFGRGAMTRRRFSARPMPIWRRTCDTEVDVHENAFQTCTRPIPQVAGGFGVALWAQEH